MCNRLQRSGIGLLVVAALASGCIPWGGERVEPWETLSRLGAGHQEVSAINGDGSSFDTAFVVHTTVAAVQGAEERWIWQLEPATRQNRGTLRRSTAWVKRKSYDTVTLTRSDGSVRTFYFDTSRLVLESPRGRL